MTPESQQTKSSHSFPFKSLEKWGAADPPVSGPRIPEKNPLTPENLYFSVSAGCDSVLRWERTEQLLFARPFALLLLPNY
jgi:hypothetical protein